MWFLQRASVVFIEEARALHDHIWTTGPLPIYGRYVKPNADRDQQTGPSAHVGICHTYLTTCVICGGKKCHIVLCRFSKCVLHCPTFSLLCCTLYSDGRWCFYYSFNWIITRTPIISFPQCQFCRPSTTRSYRSCWGVGPPLQQKDDQSRV